MWQASVFTVFPEIYPANLGISNLQKTHGKLWQLNVIDLKQFSSKYGRIDDIPYGGGAGMVLCPNVFENAFNALSSDAKNLKRIYPSPRGKKIEQQDFRNLSQSSGVMLLCGRYEGVDQRILDLYDFEEWSLGDFILMGGDIAALAIIEGSVRLIPGVVQKQESIDNDSLENSLLEYDQYTRPRSFNGMDIPAVLMSGNHKEIEKFRLQQSLSRTAEDRQDLWYRYLDSKLSGHIKLETQTEHSKLCLNQCNAKKA